MVPKPFDETLIIGIESREAGKSENFAYQCLGEDLYSISYAHVRDVASKSQKTDYLLS